MQYREPEDHRPVSRAFRPHEYLTSTSMSSSSATIENMEPGTVVAVLDHGELRVPIGALDDADVVDGTPFLLERREDGLLLRPMTTQEEIDWERASGREPEIFYSDEEFDAALRAQMKPLDG